jgi:hypothetical protein
MGRATPATLALLSELMQGLRAIPMLTEKSPGIFYMKRLPMLHFHQDGEEIYAHLKCVEPKPSDFDRGFDYYPVHTKTEQRRLIAETARRCQSLNGKKP